jgi:hypothetical protein
MRGGDSGNEHTFNATDADAIPTRRSMNNGRLETIFGAFANTCANGLSAGSHGNRLIHTTVVSLTIRTNCHSGRRNRARQTRRHDRGESPTEPGT